MYCRHPSSQLDLRGYEAQPPRLPLPLLDCCAGAFIPRGQGVRPNQQSFLVTEISEHLIPGLRLGPFPQLWITIHSPDGPDGLTSLRPYAPSGLATVLLFTYRCTHCFKSFHRTTDGFRVSSSSPLGRIIYPHNLT